MAVLVPTYQRRIPFGGTVAGNDTNSTGGVWAEFVTFGAVNQNDTYTSIFNHIERVILSEGRIIDGATLSGTGAGACVTTSGSTITFAQASITDPGTVVTLLIFGRDEA